MPYLIYNIHVCRLLVDWRNSYNRGEASDGSGTAHGGGRNPHRTAASDASLTRFENEKAFLVRKLSARDEPTDAGSDRSRLSNEIINLSQCTCFF